METVNILAARNNLSQLVAAASAGEEVVIAKRGVPVARLVAIEPEVHSAARAAEWLTVNHVPPHATRSAEDLDAQIAAERTGWE
ncbi:prevent-host-death family protein [Salinibacterium sp. CAN_S4]|uniref:type II toxin-antitoxin system Phd/YefM family antitoxin n=1 Tax=Salinibacterium sp. CAN_S4 TaxID=2787727 RepID=UPI0018EFCE57